MININNMEYEIAAEIWNGADLIDSQLISQGSVIMNKSESVNRMMKEFNKCEANIDEDYPGYSAVIRIFRR